MAFYTFSQNNSGGSFVFDKEEGITHFVIIEADNVGEALSRAETIGLYFDGFGDCPCCGDRWSNGLNETDATDEPKVYSQPASEYGKGQKWCTAWMEEGHEIVVHYKDGRKEWFGVHKS